jgi:hypothetical protein
MMKSIPQSLSLLLENVLRRIFMLEGGLTNVMAWTFVRSGADDGQVGTHHRAVMTKRSLARIIEKKERARELLYREIEKEYDLTHQRAEEERRYTSRKVKNQKRCHQQVSASVMAITPQVINSPE